MSPFDAKPRPEQVARARTPWEITPRALHARLAEGADIELLDVRDPWEYRLARIEGSRLLPLSELAGRLAELDRSREIVVVCKIGERSGWATQMLRRAGFPRVHNLTGGLLAWARDVDRSIVR